MGFFIFGMIIAACIVYTLHSDSTPNMSDERLKEIQDDIQKLDEEMHELCTNGKYDITAMEFVQRERDYLDRQLPKDKQFANR